MFPTAPNNGGYDTQDFYFFYFFIAFLQSTQDT
jgi:hypothetical protein